MFSLFKNEFPHIKEHERLSISKDDKYVRNLIKGLIKEKFSSKLKLYVLDSGSCTGCELELQVLFSPLYNLASFGMEVVYEYSKADILLITGVMTENMHAELKMIDKHFKNPHGVIILGDCTVFSVPFKDTFAIHGTVNALFPLAFHIGGCPPEPSLILKNFYEFLNNY